MKRAIKLAEKGRITAPPNPWVGSVVIKEEKLLGEGYHERPGSPHAEKIALAECGKNAKGATLYTTLEPCCHHGRTPPCTKSIINAQIKTVVIGINDPDPLVSGKGIAELKKAGIEVIESVLEKEIQKSLAPYIHHRKTNRPYTIVKMATSIDGKIVHPNGRSQWITCEKAREDVHHLRHESCAVLVGSNTALKDLPRLTPRIAHVQKNPARVILDSTGKVTKGPIFNTEVAPTIIATTDLCPKATIKEWERQGVKVLILPQENRLEHLLDELGAMGIIQLFCEGGSTLISHLYNEKLIDQLIHYQGPHLFGEGGTPLFSEIEPTSLDGPPRMRLESSGVIGSCVKSTWHF